MLLETLTWPEAKQADLARRIVLLPLGSFEQHGPHLPFTTDTDLVTAVARGVERLRPERILCLPTVWTGHSTHHLAFPGTLSVRQRAYVELLVNLAEGIAGLGATRVFLLNGHGGNDVPARFALRELKDRHPAVQFVFASYWSLAAAAIGQVRTSTPGGLGHACELETSLMLHLHPERVRMHLARRDGPPHADAYRRIDMQHGRPVYSVQEFHEMTASGVIGHPDLASAEKGARFLAGILAGVVAFVDAFAGWEGPGLPSPA